MNRAIVQRQDRDVWIAAAVFLLTVAFYSLTWFHGLKGGVSTIGAERVLNGGIPYRDFWTMYAPGHFYLLALLFRVFGTHLLVEVIAASIVSAAAASMLYLLVRNLAGRLPSVVCAAAFVMAMFHTGYFQTLNTYPPVILCILTAHCLAVRFYRSGRMGYLFGCGLAAGVAILFKHDVGAYTVAAITAGLAAYNLVSQPDVSAALRRIAVHVLIFSGGIVALTLLPVSYFVYAAGPDLFQDLFVFPATDFRYARPESYPPIFPAGLFASSLTKTADNLFTWAALTLPLIPVAAGLFATVRFIRKRAPLYAATGVTFLAAWLLHYMAAHVQINTHIISMAVYASALSVMAYESIIPERYRTLKPAFAALFVLVWFLSFAARPAYLLWTGFQSQTAVLHLPRLAGFKVSTEEAATLEGLSEIVKRYIPEGAKVYAGLRRHDVVIVNDPLLYFVLGRLPATRYHELHPAVTDTAAVQAEMIHDLRVSKVPVVVLSEMFSDDILETARADFAKHLPRTGAKDLDRYLRDNYYPAVRLSQHAVWLHKSIPAPTMSSGSRAR
ncbi:MAG: glycosyltransferase family 39 protein [Bryobacterales bacterium]|nr:glycosyltransferase family 39 protein [Bryobacterales bacterium]